MYRDSELAKFGTTIRQHLRKLGIACYDIRRDAGKWLVSIDSSEEGYSWYTISEVLKNPTNFKRKELL